MSYRLEELWVAVGPRKEPGGVARGAMKYQVLATDYDGTIAHDGVVDDATIEALRRVRGAGLRLILVTGRELVSLFDTFAHPDVFDWIVAENGAVLYEPRSGTVQTLASPPPPQLVRALEQARVPLSVGHSIVATVVPYEQQVLMAIREAGIEWHVIFNKDAVMALPSDVTKATGLAAALKAVDIPPERTIGIGDAENDQAFLRVCGLSVAVENALPALKEMADLVTRGAEGQGVRELIDRLLTDQLATVRRASAARQDPRGV
jgi:hydroxymethylpyrimidine pyrophosphatase-like HAD family hydrolase